MKTESKLDAFFKLSQRGTTVLIGSVTGAFFGLYFSWRYLCHQPCAQSKSCDKMR